MNDQKYNSEGLTNLKIAIITEGAKAYRKALRRQVKAFGRRLGKKEYATRMHKDNEKDYYNDPFGRLYQEEKFFFSDYFQELTTVDPVEGILKPISEEVRQEAIEEGWIKPEAQIVDWASLTDIK